jgi:two-component system, chemotaxis family, chemotaxis protein CheY
MTRPTCLIVDDSRTIRMAARRIVEELRFDVAEAEHGEAALAQCGTRMPEAILLDWNMPVMDGIEFLRKLRAMENGAAPRVVFCTTESELDRIVEALEAGADEYVMKPFDRDILEAKFLQIGLL